MPEIIYILECKDNFYYIGVAERRRIIKRLRQHRDGKHPDCKWTKKHRAVKMIASTMLKFKEQPTFETEKWMKMKGINRVRGGIYKTLKLNHDEIRRIKRKFKFPDNACWKCGRVGHYVTNCTASQYFNGEAFSDDEDDEEEKTNTSSSSSSSGYSYSTKVVDNRPTPGMTWHSIPP